MNRIRISTFLICLLVCGVPFLHNSAEAEEIYLQDGWHASVTNTQFLTGYDTPEVPLHWCNGGWYSSQSSSHIATQTEQEADWANFNMTSGWVTVGQEDAYVTTALALSNGYHAVQFDWTTNWTGVHAAQHLRFEVWGGRGNWPWEGPEGYYLFDYFYPGAGLRSGHATMWTGGTGNLELHLVASPVPEPTSLLALFSGLAGVGGMVWRRRATR